ncbi:MAG: endonuclease/exonuclease/phosphatase family protein [Bacteroidales bacterium]|jgi:endonuclease/exonuclease/phosphatase family metal-dependent hydrolase
MRRLLVLFAALFCTLFASGQRSGLKVMTFNIRYDNPADGDYSWKNRLPLIKDILLQEGPDIVGFQEALKNQVDGLQEFLKDYTWAGVGRDDGAEKGEYSVIFYRSIRFIKLGGSTFWLSETPSVPGSRSWKMGCTRIVTWVKLMDQNSNNILFVFNTHFDNASAEARAQSAKLLKEKITEIAGNSTCIITGDFNDSTSSVPIQTLTSGQGALVNTQNLSMTKPGGPDYTFIDFPFNPQKGNTCDYIFLKNAPIIKVIRHLVLTFNRDNKYPSDHLPVCVELQILKR